MSGTRTVLLVLKYSIYILIQSSPDLPCFSGESKNARQIGGTVNRGKVNTCSIVKHDIGGTQEARYIEGHGKSGHGKSRYNCTYQPTIRCHLPSKILKAKLKI